MDKFDIPIVIFSFKRIKTTLRILEVVKQINPSKLYIISDQGRNDQEKEVVKKCREAIIQFLKTWQTDIIFDFAEVNRGVYENIGLGACRVLEKEKCAIFLEDDNLPAITFFGYCKDLLKRYENNEKILWICGTNYLENYKATSGASYIFTQHLLPCGWASWSSKFLKYYEKDFSNLNAISIEKIKNRYLNKKLFKQQYEDWLYEKKRNERGDKYISWDFHMSFSLMYHDLYGISPCRNQIENIGVDAYSTHGGNSFKDVMTRRFCGISKYELELPIQYTDKVVIDPNYEKKVSKIILFPWKRRVKRDMVHIVKRIFKIEQDKSIWTFFKDREDGNK